VKDSKEILLKLGVFSDCSRERDDESEPIPRDGNPPGYIERRC
jgi:hypothetical protein